MTLSHYLQMLLIEVKKRLYQYRMYL